MHVYLFGASGKMGRALAEKINASSSFQRSPTPEESDLLIDFSSPHATMAHLELVKKWKKPLVLGTTGLTEEIHQQIASTATYIPILYSPNFSLMITLCLESIAVWGRFLLGKSAIEIIETHHLQKKDAPSGTALAMACAIPNGEICLQPAERQEKNKILIRSQRIGDTIGEHRITFTSPNEQIELTHRAFSREAFVYGALKAALFLHAKPPGQYTLKDVILDSTTNEAFL